MEKKELANLIKSFALYAEMLPGVVIIHQLNPFSPIYMSSNGLDLLGITTEELILIGTDYHHKFFNNEDMEDYLVKLDHLLKSKDEEEIFTFFQQVKLKKSGEWVWHLSSCSIFFKDQNHNPSHIITIAVPIDGLKHIPRKAERLLTENKFFQENLQKFLSLGNREKEILRLVALGKSSLDIANDLFISTETVNTHRKKIKKKLELSSVYEFTLYAQAFDLI